MKVYMNKWEADRQGHHHKSRTSNESQISQMKGIIDKILQNKHLIFCETLES